MWLMGFPHHRQSLSYGSHFHMALEEIPPSPAESWFCQRKSQPARLFPCSHNYVIHLWLKSTREKPLLVCDLTLWLREKVPTRGHLLWCPYALIAALRCVFELELQPWQRAPAQFFHYFILFGCAGYFSFLDCMYRGVAVSILVLHFNQNRV